MADIAIFRINYKSDFILTLNSDAGWMTPFCIKFWTGAPSQAYFAGYDGTTYTNCAPVYGEPTKLLVQFDDHHLPIGDLKFQISYHFTVADFPTSVEDEAINQDSVIIEVDDAPAQVMLDLNGETAPEIEFSLPAYANEAQRIENEQQRIANEEQRIANEQTRIDNEALRISAEQTRQDNEAQRIRNEHTRINQEEARVREFATLKRDAQEATTAANDAAALANQKAQLAADKAQLAADKAALAQDAANLANQKAQLAADKAALAQDAADLANQKAQLAQQKAEYAQTQGDYAKQQGDYAKEQGDYAKRKGDDAATQMQQQAQAFSEAQAARQTSYEQAEGTESGSVAGDGSRWGAFKTNEAARDAKVDAKVADITNLQEAVAEGAVYDVSAKNPTAGPNNDGKWGSLSALLSDANLNTLIPSAVRRGGMSIKFVLTSDNMYVQYRLMKNTWSTTVGDWQGVDDELIAGSKNLIEGGAVFDDSRYIKDELGIDVYAFEYSAAGEQQYPIKSGKTYILNNTADATITVSFRETQSGENHCTTSMVVGASAEVTADNDYAWVRCGRAATFTIREKTTVNSRLTELETGLAAEKSRAEGVEETLQQGINGISGRCNTMEDNTLELFSKVSAYLVEWELGQTYINSNHELVYQESTTVITLKRGLHYLHLYPGDIIMVSDSDYSNKMINVSYHNGDGAWSGFGWQLQDFIVQTEGYYWVGMSYRPQSTISDVEELSKYFQIKSLKQRINEVNTDLQGQTAEIRDCLFVTPDSIVQVGKGVNASTGAYVDVELQNAISLDLTQLKAKYIRFVWTVSGTYGYGFFVGGTWTGYKTSSFPSGLYYQETTVKVPAGATEFRFSWKTDFYTGDNYPLCVLTDGVDTAYKKASSAIGGINLIENAIFKEKTLNIASLISNGGVQTDGSISSNNTYGHLEIQLNEEISYRSFTFKRTYINPTTHDCYGFIINNQWVGYKGNAGAYDEITEITVDVPNGATVFKVCWNRNQLTDANFYLKANLFKNTGDEETSNVPVFQFTPDFILSRVPTYPCPTLNEAGNLKPAGLYAMYDALMALYPNYITKVDCDAGAQAALGITAPEYMNGLPIYMYKLTPKIGGNGEGVDKTSRVKVFITSMHPQEKLGLYSMYYTIKMICENWTNDVNAEQMRSLIDIYVMPCPWTWNMENDSRANYNGVNGNRQFPTRNWTESGQGTYNWTGSEPLSEYEAKVINYYFLQIKPDVCLDVHTSGNDNVGHMGIMLVNKYDQPLIDLCGIIARTTSNRAIQDNSNFPSSPDTCLYGVYPEDGSSMGEFYEYAYEQGCKYSILCEESPYSRWNDGVFDPQASIVEQYTDGIQKEQVQYIFNILLRLTRQACVQYYKV